MFKPKINMVTLGVQDLVTSTAFYEGLGWKKSSESQEGISFFQLGAMVLGLFPFDGLEKDCALSLHAGPCSIALAYNATSEEEVDALLEHVKTIGGTICKPAEKVFRGGYSGYFQDIDGYIWEVAYNPFWKMNKKGEVLLEDTPAT